jgi:hypothetical protein
LRSGKHEFFNQLKINIQDNDVIALVHTIPTSQKKHLNQSSYEEKGAKISSESLMTMGTA